jgi:hypothetical protein
LGVWTVKPVAAGKHALTVTLLPISRDIKLIFRLELALFLSKDSKSFSTNYSSYQPRPAKQIWDTAEIYIRS